jgi:glycogen operon protein
MILMGDEARRTQNGNNNNYCHDDATNWFDWSMLTKHADVHRFVQLLCARRALRATGHERERLTLAQLIQRSTKSWHGVRLNAPDWGDASHSIAFSAELREDGMLAHLILNAYWEPLDFELPQSLGDGRPLQWRRWIDTALPTPDDISPWQDSPAIPSTPYHAGPRSVVMLFANLGG